MLIFSIIPEQKAIATSINVGVPPLLPESAVPPSGSSIWT